MQIIRDENGIWHYDKDGPLPDWSQYYSEAIPRYLNALDNAFSRAQESCEFEFLLSLFRYRGVQDAGWDPFETSLRAVDSITNLYNNLEDFEVQRNLSLWLYGHIVEASEPYEILANLIDVSQGGTYSTKRFPNKGLRPQTPGEKIIALKTAAITANIPDVIMPLQEIWDKDLRNAIFHSDYAIYGGEVRVLSPAKSYNHEQITTYVNRAIAYFESIKNLYKIYISSYQKPCIIDVHPDFSKDPEEEAVVIVREGHGAIGVKDNWSPKQLVKGKIPYYIGRFYPDEIKLLKKDPTLCLLPPRIKD